MWPFVAWRARVTEIVDTATSGTFPWSRFTDVDWYGFWGSGVAPDEAADRFLTYRDLNDDDEPDVRMAPGSN
jgi:hypothetical protein